MYRRGDGLFSGCRPLIGSEFWVVVVIDLDVWALRVRDHLGAARSWLETRREAALEVFIDAMIQTLFGTQCAMCLKSEKSGTR